MLMPVPLFRWWHSPVEKGSHGHDECRGVIDLRGMAMAVQLETSTASSAEHQLFGMRRLARTETRPVA